MKTYDQMVIDKLKEIQPTTMKHLSEELGYKTTKACYHLMKGLLKSGKIVRDITKKPYQYKVNENE